jgi:hypothetical protein
MIESRFHSKDPNLVVGGLIFSLYVLSRHEGYITTQILAFAVSRYSLHQSGTPN